ncbi:MAG: zinc-binding alcohol dehydrogenase family protein, partial [Gemmatimonadales bacterium]
ITAWEILYDRFGIVRGAAENGRALLVIGGAGGVGSIMIQLARQLTGLTVIATASRTQTRDWCVKLGAHHVIDHTKPLAEQLKAEGHPTVALIASLTGTEQYFPQVPDIIAPFGKFALIDDPKTMDAAPLKRKAVSLHWESMFTRSLFSTPDMIEQHRLLTEIAVLVDAGKIISTATQEITPINAANLIRAQTQVESGTTIGKVVVHGW